MRGAFCEVEEAAMCKGERDCGPNTAFISAFASHNATFETNSENTQNRALFQNKKTISKHTLFQRLHRYYHELEVSLFTGKTQRAQPSGHGRGAGSEAEVLQTGASSTQQPQHLLVACLRCEVQGSEAGMARSGFDVRPELQQERHQGSTA